MHRDPTAQRPMTRMPAHMARQRLFCARHNRKYPAWQLANGRPAAGSCMACDLEREQLVGAGRAQGEGAHG